VHWTDESQLGGLVAPFAHWLKTLQLGGFTAPFVQGGNTLHDGGSIAPFAQLLLHAPLINTWPGGQEVDGVVVLLEDCKP
jgi:hypothetical protein